MTFDNWTFVIWIGFVPFVWLPWEITSLVLRGEKVSVKTISMVAQHRGQQLPCFVYFWTSMPVHWWAPIRWASTGGTVAFWIIQAALLAWNLVRWKHTAALPYLEWPRWERWLNWPVFWMIAGPAAAALLFPQNSPVPWGAP